MSKFLVGIGMSEYLEKFKPLKDLDKLTEHILKKKMQISSLGHRKIIIKELNRIKTS